MKAVIQGIWIEQNFGDFAWVNVNLCVEDVKAWKQVIASVNKDPGIVLAEFSLGDSTRKITLPSGRKLCLG